jgi:hypothetical protein
VVVTKSIIAFALINEEHIVDEIPLAQVDALEDMHNVAPDGSELLSLTDVDQTRRFRHAIQIATAKNGHNSGRTYRLQVPGAARRPCPSPARVQRGLRCSPRRVPPRRGGRAAAAQVASEDECRKLVATLRTLAAAARDKADAKTRFQHSQKRDRQV